MEPRRTSPLRGLLDAILAMVSDSTPVRPILLVGEIGAGKTSAGLRLASLLRRSGVSPGGVLAPRILDGDETVGYSLVDLSTQTTHPFAGLEPSDLKVGRFYVSTAGLELAHRVIDHAAQERVVTFVDEVGRAELGGGGHAPALRSLLSSSSVPILLVRDQLVDDVIRSFALKDPMLYDVTEARDPGLASRAGSEILWQIVDSVPFPFLVTVAEDGFPTSRPMTLADRNEGALWFATSRGSRKVAHIEANPNVTVLFVDSDRFNYASISGRARLVDDPEQGAALWHDEWRDDWPEGPSDPDYVLLRVDAIRGQYLRGSTGESGTVDLAAPAA